MTRIDGAAWPALRLIAADGVAPTPWRNGGGRTRELLCWPAPDAHAPAGGEWILRISLADIDADGPFSAFDGIERWFAVIDGDGVDLDWPAAGRHAAVRRADGAIRFDGAGAPGCRLLGGPTRDLNVMVRRAAAEARVDALHAGRDVVWAHGPRAVFVPAAARLVRDDGRGARAAERLPARTLVWCETGDASSWSLHPAEAGGDAGTVPLGFHAGLQLRPRHPHAPLAP